MFLERIALPDYLQQFNCNLSESEISVLQIRAKPIEKSSNA